MRKKSVEWTTNRREREGTPYYIIYIGRGGPTPALPGREGEGETENGKLTDPLRRFAPRPPNLEGQRKRETESGRSFYERRKAGREKRDATKRKDKDMEGKILPSRAHEHVVREDEGESPGRTGASHPGGQK